MPQDATPGDHAAGIVASYATPAASGGTSIVQENRVGTRIYLRVDGPLSPGLGGVRGAVAGYNGTLNPVGAGSGFAGFDIVNTGNTRLSAQPVVHITGPFGIDFGTVQLAPVRNIVPGGTAHVTGLVPGVAPLLLMFADISATPLPGDGLAATDPLPAAATASAIAWAVPWMLLLIVAVVAGIVVLIVFLRLSLARASRGRPRRYADQIRAEARDESQAVPMSRPGAIRLGTEEREGHHRHAVAAAVGRRPVVMTTASATRSPSRSRSQRRWRTSWSSTDAASFTSIATMRPRASATRSTSCAPSWVRKWEAGLRWPARTCACSA